MLALRSSSCTREWSQWYGLDTLGSTCFLLKAQQWPKHLYGRRTATWCLPLRKRRSHSTPCRCSALLSQWKPSDCRALAHKLPKQTQAVSGLERGAGCTQQPARCCLLQWLHRQRAWISTRPACMRGPHNGPQLPAGATPPLSCPPETHLQHVWRILLQHGLHPPKQGSWVHACPAYRQPQAAAGAVPLEGRHLPQQGQQEGCGQPSWWSGRLKAFLQDGGGQAQLSMLHWRSNKSSQVLKSVFLQQGQQEGVRVCGSPLHAAAEALLQDRGQRMQGKDFTMSILVQMQWVLCKASTLAAGFSWMAGAKPRFLQSEDHALEAFYAGMQAS